MIAKSRSVLCDRKLCELVLNRADFLPVADQALLENVLGRGVLPRDLARLEGGGNARVRAIQERVRCLVRRLLHPDVACVIRQHDNWPLDLRRTALALWVRGESVGAHARSRGLTIYRVRQHVLAIRALIQQTRRARSRQ